MTSIRARLTFFYASTAFILITVVALFLYWQTTNILYKANYQFLSDEIDTIQYILDNEPLDTEALKQEIIDTPLEPDGSMYRYYIRIIDDKNATLMQTPGMEDIIQPKKINRNPDKKIYSWIVNSDAKYLVVQSSIKIGEGNKFGAIQIALDTTYQHELVRDRKLLLISLIAGAFCALILGFVIAHRGMRSLYVLTDNVKNITAQSLHQRIDPKSWPTELRQLGLAFNQMLDRIETSFVRLKQFSSDLAHELRTPIHNLVNASEVTLSHAQTMADHRGNLESNLEELHRISQVIENILFLARAENPQLAIQKKSILAHEEIKLICEFYQALADEKNITISQKGEAEIEVEPVMFRRMLSNILSNALKYTSNNGFVRFSVSELNNNVQISVTDNGIGIASEHLSHIFDRFYRVDAARSQNSVGTGLGLAIVKSIIDLHQANIMITSTLGVGTTVRCEFRTT